MRDEHPATADEFLKVRKLTKNGCTSFKAIRVMDQEGKGP